MRESPVNDARKIEIHMEMIEICFLSLILGENQLQIKNQKSKVSTKHWEYNTNNGKTQKWV